MYSLFFLNDFIGKAETFPLILNENLLVLYEQELIKVEYDEELRAHISPTDEGMKYFKSKYEEE